MSSETQLCGPSCLHEEKVDFGEGPWQSEPDRVDFRHAGFPCLLHRNGHLGHWCGYVGVPPGHPAHGKGYEDIDVEVHGGLTYAHRCEPPICHVAQPGEPDQLWWLGFDAAHCWDLVPGAHAVLRRIGALTEMDRDEAYRDMAYPPLDRGLQFRSRFVQFGRYCRQFKIGLTDGCTKVLRSQLDSLDPSKLNELPKAKPRKRGARKK